MKVLHVGAEIFPLIKTGGLADVMGALPQALLARDAQVRLLLPGMPAIMQGVVRQRLVCEIGPAFGAARVRLQLGEVQGSGVPAYVIDAPYLYRRDGNPYLDADGAEWGDNQQRFALLGWVAAHLAGGEIDTDWAPDLVHAHDWHAAMCCAYLAAHPGPSVASVFTVHNLAYQGLFDANDYHLLGLPARFMAHHALEFHGQLSFMKAGLAYAQRVTTVSPTYAREMATEAFGFGLDGLIRARGTDVSGILNGVDGTVWDPQTDPRIGANYSSRALRGKADCKARLQGQMGLAADPDAPDDADFPQPQIGAAELERCDAAGTEKDEKGSAEKFGDALSLERRDDGRTHARSLVRLFLFYSEHCVRSELFGNENLEAKKATVKVKIRTFRTFLPGTNTTERCPARKGG